MTYYTADMCTEMGLPNICSWYYRSRCVENTSSAYMQIWIILARPKHVKQLLGARTFLAGAHTRS